MKPEVMNDGAKGKHGRQFIRYMSERIKGNLCLSCPYQGYKRTNRVEIQSFVLLSYTSERKAFHLNRRYSLLLNLSAFLCPNRCIAFFKTTGMISLEEVPSKIEEGDNTFRFTWIKKGAEVYVTDTYLKEWLFTKNDRGGNYF